jgi:hypothetical protein
VPLPLPLAPEVTLTNTSLLTAVHAQPFGAVTPKVPAPPAEPYEADGGESENEHASSLTIVPVPCPVATPALVGLARLTKNVSSGSTAASPPTVTATGLPVSPGAKVSVPDADW